MEAPPLDPAALAAADTDHAVQLAPRIWWVGHRQVGDPFQCHAYLIEQGRQSVLIDPGSALTFDHTRRKIEEIVPLDHIAWILCQHQDPDITAALPTLAGLVGPDTHIVTHWRVQTLIKHYGLDLPVHLIEEGDWELPLADRTLRFVFTPYAHFPGAFCTFDPRSGILFSSDLFGGFTETFALVAQDESYFEAMRPFHEHYIPTREILQFAIDQVRAFPIRLVAPQHGSLIPQPLARRLMDRLYTLDCGLYLLGDTTTDVLRLSRLNESLRAVLRAVTMTREFKNIARRLVEITRQWVPIEHLEFYSAGPEAVLSFAPETRYRGVEAPAPADVAALLGTSWPAWQDGPSGHAGFLVREVSGGHRVLVPLSSDSRTIDGVALMAMDAYPTALDELRQLVHNLAQPLGVALERETLLRDLEEKRDAIYQRSIRDPLTQLYTRIYMRDAARRMCKLQDRGSSGPLAVALFDVDHFKSVNDTWGHNMGDHVLREVARVLREGTRQELDIPVRLGGEELVVLSNNMDAVGLVDLAERLREAVAALAFPAPMDQRRITVSVGTALREPGESLEQVIERADRALYRAKESGRNRVCAAD